MPDEQEAAMADEFTPLDSDDAAGYAGPALAPPKENGDRHDKTEDPHDAEASYGENNTRRTLAGCRRGVQIITSATDGHTGYGGGMPWSRH
jgi:hypothetical protein